VIERAELGARNDDDGQPEIARPVADIVIRRQWNAPAAHALDGKVGEPAGKFKDAAVLGWKIDRPIFRAGGDERRGGFAKMNRIDLVQTEDGVRGHTQKLGIPAVTGGNRLQRGGGMSPGAPIPHQPRGEPGLAHARIGAGDEETGHEGR